MSIGARQLSRVPWPVRPTCCCRCHFWLLASASQDGILLTVEPDKLIDFNGLSAFVVFLFLEPDAVIKTSHSYLHAQATCLYRA